MIVAPCRSFGPLGFDLALVPRPDGRGYYMTARWDVLFSFSVLYPDLTVGAITARRLRA